MKFTYKINPTKNCKFCGWFLFYHKTARKDKANKWVKATDGSYQHENNRKIHFFTELKLIEPHLHLEE